ncbi:MAG: hypothetical protein LUH10_10265 [Tannerellaceae bacterium]|nr:hypothetical protein [Tannerellaceae bacterium]
MEKKYNQSEENPENNKVEEPAIAYGKTIFDVDIEEWALQFPNRPLVFTDEEKIKQIEQGMKEIENGDFISHEYVLQKIRRRYS